jgi:hypothetical protein
VLTNKTLTTPALGAATATSVNKVIITEPATAATITIANNGSLTTAGAYAISLTATGITGLVLPTTGTLATLAGGETFTNKTLTSPTLTTPALGTPASGVLTSCTGTAAGLTAGAVTGVSVAGGKTLTASNTLTLAGTDSTTMTFPPASSSVGYLNVPQNSVSDSYTLVAGDAGKHIYLSAGANKTLTIPANASVPFPNGTVIAGVNGTAGNWSVAITSDTLTMAVTGSTGTRTIAAKGIFAIMKVADTSWFITGSGLS